MGCENCGKETGLIPIHGHYHCIYCKLPSYPCCEGYCTQPDEPDYENDGDALASAGFGTDEDYGLFSEDGSDRL